MKKTTIPVILLTGALVLILWAPWISHDAAAARVTSAFENTWRDVADGCGFNCRGCGILDSSRALAGVRVSYEFACGMIPYDSPEFHETGVAFVSFLGTVSGLPKP